MKDKYHKNRKHGMCINDKRHPVYTCWEHMKRRCFNPKNKDYKHYGGRGITICKRWLKLENFVKDMGEKPTPKHSLDRINNDGNYCKKNCRWATMMQQHNNRRGNLLLTYKGKTQSASDWAREVGLPSYLIRQRIRISKWSVEDTLTIIPSFSNRWNKKRFTY